MVQDTVLEIDTAKRVVELYKPGEEMKGLIVLWHDEKVTVCWKKDKEIQCCSTTDGPEMFYIAQAFYTEPGEKFGYRVKELHREG